MIFDRYHLKLRFKQTEVLDPIIGNLIWYVIFTIFTDSKLLPYYEKK